MLHSINWKDQPNGDQLILLAQLIPDEILLNWDCQNNRTQEVAFIAHWPVAKICRIANYQNQLKGHSPLLLPFRLRVMTSRIPRFACSISIIHSAHIIQVLARTATKRRTLRSVWSILLAHNRHCVWNHTVVDIFSVQIEVRDEQIDSLRTICAMYKVSN